MRSETLFASTRAALHGVCQALQPGSNFASRLEAGFAGIINGRVLRRGENDFSSGRGDETEKPAHAKIDLAQPAAALSGVAGVPLCQQSSRANQAAPDRSAPQAAALEEPL
jgi:hypothetical protein